jgi:uncharacterized protein (TIGR00251 family)
LARITVYVHPRARRNAVAVRDESTVEIWTTAPPVDGRANEAVVDLLAKRLGVPRSVIHVVAGATARTKIVEIAVLTPEQVRERLDQ